MINVHLDDFAQVLEPPASILKLLPKIIGVLLIRHVLLCRAGCQQMTKSCLVKIGINELDQDGIFRLLAAVLHLLNIGFVSGK